MESNFLISCHALASCGVLKRASEKSVSLPLHMPCLLLRATHISTLINSSSGAARGFGSSRGFGVFIFYFIFRTATKTQRLRNHSRLHWRNCSDTCICNLIRFWRGFPSVQLPTDSAWGRLMMRLPGRFNFQPGNTSENSFINPRWHIPALKDDFNGTSSRLNEVIAGWRWKLKNRAPVQTQLPILGHPSVRTNLIGPLFLLPVINAWAKLNHTSDFNTSTRRSHKEEVFKYFGLLYCETTHLSRGWYTARPCLVLLSF